ncbi:MAG TPA: tetratricopeptide repeat protein, partial [Vicinamibacteria bacterium]|nr:tetratricopeptide repeat protein [Vicinamibacteria bacterium]
MRFGRTILAVALSLGVAAPALAQALPTAVQASFEEGVRALKAGRLQAAEQAFRAVLAKGGDVAFVHNNLGIVLQERRRHEEAIAEFRTATLLDPGELQPGERLPRGELHRPLELRPGLADPAEGEEARPEQDARGDVAGVEAGRLPELRDRLLVPSALLEDDAEVVVHEGDVPPLREHGP